MYDCCTDPQTHPFVYSDYQESTRTSFERQRVRSTGSLATLGPQHSDIKASASRRQGGRVTREHQSERHARRVSIQELGIGKFPSWFFRPFDRGSWLLEGGVDIVLSIHDEQTARGPWGCFRCNVQRHLTVADRDGHRFPILLEMLLRLVVSPPTPPELILAFRLVRDDHARPS